MSLVDIPIAEETIADKANGIREKLAGVISIADIRLREIRQIVATHGRPAIAAELGDDAPAMLIVYTKLKEAIESAKEITVEELP